MNPNILRLSGSLAEAVKPRGIIDESITLWTEDPLFPVFEDAELISRLRSLGFPVVIAFGGGAVVGTTGEVFTVLHQMLRGDVMFGPEGLAQMDQSGYIFPRTAEN